MDKKEATMDFFEFCERLKADGCHIGEDGHVYRKDGRILSRQCRNGYYMLRKMYGHHTYHFMEHRVVWYLCNGEFDESLTINHKDFDRANNKIENLELMTQKDNLKYTRDAGRWETPKGEDSAKSIFTNTEVQAIRYLKKNGWSTKQIQSLFNVKWGNTINRIINGSRYGNVVDASDVLAIYPAIVSRTWRTDLPKEQRMNNAILGLVGELGELVDMQKKTLYHGHEMDVVHEMLEVGDILYYLTALCIELDVDMAEVMYENAQKLYDRYPEGFSTDKSLNRAEGDI